jgi:hypothetical protein
MADTQRTREALIALFADNVTGQISAQDLRDFLVTVMETPEFTYAGDFFNGPIVGGITTDKTTRGFHLYDQTLHSDYSASFGMPLAYNAISAVWQPADLSNSAVNPARGIPADSYASGATDMKILVKGLIYDSGLSRLSGFVGKPIFLQSAATVNSASIDTTPGTSDSAKGIIGYVVGSTVTANSFYKWHFDGIGNWPVTGV